MQRHRHCTAGKFIGRYRKPEGHERTVLRNGVVETGEDLSLERIHEELRLRRFDQLRFEENLTRSSRINILCRLNGDPLYSTLYEDTGSKGLNMERNLVRIIRRNSASTIGNDRRFAVRDSVLPTSFSPKPDASHYHPRLHAHQGARALAVHARIIKAFAFV